MTAPIHIDWDIPIEMDDGLLLRADVFLPDPDDVYPVILPPDPYAKGLAFQEGYPDERRIMTSQHPDVERGSIGLYQNWEMVDPKSWVPDGYAVLRVDSSGCGRSPLLHRRLLPAADRGPGRMHRMGGDPTREHGQGRSQRDLGTLKNRLTGCGPFLHDATPGPAHGRVRGAA